MDYEEFDDSMIVSTPVSAPKVRSQSGSATRHINMDLLATQAANATAAQQRRNQVLSTESAAAQYQSFVGKNADLRRHVSQKLQELEGNK